MIVNTMTLQEIHEELFKDLPALEGRIEHCKREFRRKVLKASHFPYVVTYELRTGIRRNLFMATFTANKRGKADRPLILMCGIYDRPEGSYAAVLSLDLKATSIYPPHFFKRYRERIVKDEKLTNLQLIRLYLSKCKGIYKAVADKEHNAVYHSIEYFADEEVNFVAATDEGYCFGSHFGENCVIKTIISEDDLFDDQKELFHKLREEYNNFLQTLTHASFTLT